ncbi:MAG: hypothetical protein FWF60_08800 [Oscillospiraceae bacterium]|nr:hypothetical protein [Oscillospiraceae bacterium]
MEKHKRMHKWAFPLGVILTALAVVGTVTLVRLAVGGIKQQVENPKEIQEYEKFLAKIILHDPDPFDSVAEVPLGNIPQLLDISIWAILHPDDTATPVNLPMDDDGNYLISQEKVDAEFEKIFGRKPPRHASIEGSDFGFTWDPAAKVYRIPVTGDLNIYSPRVVRPVRKTGNAIVLTVDYLASNDFEFDELGRPKPFPTAAKTMLITLYAQEDPQYPYRVGSITSPPGSVDSVPGETRLK